MIRIKKINVTKEKTVKPWMIIQGWVSKTIQNKTPERRLVKKIIVTKEKTSKPWMVIQEWVRKRRQI